MCLGASISMLSVLGALLDPCAGQHMARKARKWVMRHLCPSWLQMACAAIQLICSLEQKYMGSYWYSRCLALGPHDAPLTRMLLLRPATSIGAPLTHYHIAGVR